MKMKTYRSAATYIDRIQSPNGEITNQNDIRKEIQDFYEDLYSHKEVDESDAALGEFVSDLPKISAEDKAILEKNLTLQDLSKALKTCKDSAPGPDGIPYSL